MVGRVFFRKRIFFGGKLTEVAFECCDLGKDTLGLKAQINGRLFRPECIEGGFGLADFCFGCR